MTTTYTYETKKGTNIEVFDTKGYVTLTRNGLFVYEHQFSTIGVKLQEIELQKAFVKYGIKFTKTAIN
tara:strand:+ start:533 stop:736 length:204 start_codon:yes stop_codon:yes gene_type:complete